MGSHWGGWGEGDGIVCFVDMPVVRGLGVGRPGLPRWLGVGCLLTSLWRRLETAMCVSLGVGRDLCMLASPGWRLCLIVYASDGLFVHNRSDDRWEHRMDCGENSSTQLREMQAQIVKWWVHDCGGVSSVSVEDWL